MPQLVGNVSIRLLTTDRPDTWEVQGRGELQLAVLVEMLRREGFELTVGKPQVVTRLVDGKLHEPVEAVSIDVPEEFLGVVTQLLSLRKGRLVQMVNHGTGWARLDYSVPSRGLIGFRTEFLTETRGTGVLHHIFDRFEPWHGELRTRASGSLVADRSGLTTTYALMNLQDRGMLFVGPGVEVYEGMIIGENARSEDMDVNATKERKVTNVRSSTAEELVRLIPPRLLSLEQALEFIGEDECVEATPASVRLRKVVLDQTVRGRRTAQSKRERLRSEAREDRGRSPGRLMGRRAPRWLGRKDRRASAPLGRQDVLTVRPSELGVSPVDDKASPAGAFCQVESVVRARKSWAALSPGANSAKPALTDDATPVTVRIAPSTSVNRSRATDSTLSGSPSPITTTNSSPPIRTRTSLRRRRSRHCATRWRSTSSPTS